MMLVRHVKTEKRLLCRFLVLYLAAVLLQGCARTMMAPATLYTAGGELFGHIASELTGSHVDVLYVTDRGATVDAEGNLEYGNQRSPFVAYGSVVVEVGRDLTWDQLVAYSRHA